MKVSLILIMVFGMVISDGDVMCPFIFPCGLSINMKFSLIHIMVFGVVISDGDVTLPFIFPCGLSINMKVSLIRIMVFWMGSLVMVTLCLPSSSHMASQSTWRPALCTSLCLGWSLVMVRYAFIHLPMWPLNQHEGQPYPQDGVWGGH